MRKYQNHFSKAVEHFTNKTPIKLSYKNLRPWIIEGCWNIPLYYIEGLAQDCSNSSALAINDEYEYSVAVSHYIGISLFLFSVICFGCMARIDIFGVYLKMRKYEISSKWLWHQHGGP